MMFSTSIQNVVFEQLKIQKKKMFVFCWQLFFNCWHESESLKDYL